MILDVQSPALPVELQKCSKFVKINPWGTNVQMSASLVQLFGLLDKYNPNNTVETVISSDFLFRVECPT